MNISKAALLLGALLAGLADAQTRPAAPVVDLSRPLQGAEPTAAQPAASAQALYELMGRLEQLQGEIQQLRGLVEEQSYVIETLKKSQKDMYLDLDHRLKEMQGDAPPADTGGAIPETGAAPEAAPADSAGAAAAAPMARVPGTPEEREAYRNAYDTLQSERQAEAISLFRSFLANHPNGEFADNAHYWLGEAYYATRDFISAREYFGKVIELFPQSQKVPDAMLKIGYIDYEEERWGDARNILSRLVGGYPESTAARLAEKRLMRMSQENR